MDAVSKAVWLLFDEKAFSPLFFVHMHCIMDENKTIDYKRTFPQFNGYPLNRQLAAFQVDYSRRNAKFALTTLLQILKTRQNNHGS